MESAIRNPQSEIAGRIFQVQRFSIHDGPGIRTTVFFKGCPLRCVWCHNPEGIELQPVLSFDPSKCIGCGYCFRVCKQNAHGRHGDTHALDRKLCRACGSCTEECYAGALELIGHDATVAEVLDEVLRDRPFYETSGGGITLSGGEPLLQVDFAAALLSAAKAAGLHTTVETCGQVRWEHFARVQGLVDLWLYDVKETDSARHEQFTGMGNGLILANLRALYETGAKILLRLPIVPGLNDRPEHFSAVAQLAAAMPNLLGAEVIPYHRLGTSKLARLGLDHAFADMAAEKRPPWHPDSPPQAPTDETVAGWIHTLREQGVRLVGPTSEM
ncbi:MAG: glycyl-radical enzyme activating protein [Planctomycetaceae bacterium]